ncbi:MULTISPECIES: TraX family protein [unclassified Pantoea]|uniref:TraX family protein n=1 Tax=unclassified Pantoea TaxID=2630326 RepID=UPI00351D793C
MMQIKNLTLIKWLALFLMVGDHVNKYLLNDTVPFLYNVGRIAMPLFCFVLASNLARSGNRENGTYLRVAARLTIFALFATPAYIALGGILYGWWPLNILYTLLAVTLICYCLENNEPRSHIYALLIFVVAGSAVEFWWPAIAMAVSLWLYLKTTRTRYALLALLCCASLATVNHNFYALLAVPIVIVLGRVSLPLPRMKWFFYAFYPLHLYLIVLLRMYLSRQGYLFFT